jgi:hypothetical protein
MNAQIMTWSSNALYGGKIRADASVAAHTLQDLPGVIVPESELDLAAGDLRKLEDAATAVCARETDGDDKPATTAKALRAQSSIAALSSVLRVDEHWGISVERQSLVCPMLLIDTAGCDLQEVRFFCDAISATTFYAC